MLRASAAAYSPYQFRRPSRSRPRCVQKLGPCACRLAQTGRSGLTPQQILRSLVLMRIKNWNYRELRERIADGCTLRQFTDFYCLPVPRHDAFHRGFNRLTPETLKSINDLVVQAAV
ncbi:transposase [Bradyrhizobium sp.]|uniref:transposase n=1 Tax=Bradyrhizobium sp. TaxID=376 RepID=UPI003C1C84A3